MAITSNYPTQQGSSTLKVNQQSSDIADMAQYWPVAQALLGGTPAMRAAGKAYLPQWPKEAFDSYTRRLETATLYPAFRRTVNVMAGKPFSKELTLSDDTPAQIKEFARDIDREGQSLHNFCSHLFENVLAFGFEGVLVDYPTAPPPTEGAVRSVADEQALGLRPYFVWIKHDRVLGYLLETINGVKVLTQLRLTDQREAPDGDYGTKCIPQVRVLYPGRWELWEQNPATGEFTILHDEGTTPNMDEIPFVPFYGVRHAFMRGRSPLLDLAYLNVKHWQSQSDQDTILHVARVPVLAMIGAENVALTVGASAAISLPIGSTMEYVEHSGAAIGAGETSLATLEHQMVQTGAELLIAKPGQQVRTATEANNDAEGNKSDLQRLVEGFEGSLNKCLELMAEWINLPTGGTATLFKDFGAAMLSDVSSQLVLTMAQTGFLTRETMLKEQQRRGVLSPDLDVNQEADSAKSEGPSLGMLGAGGAAPTAPAKPASKPGRVITITRNGGSLTASES